MILPRSASGLLRAATTVLAATLLIAGGTVAACAGPTGQASQTGGAGPAAHASPAALTSTRHQDPRKHRGLFVDNLMKAAQAGPAFARIASRAQPLWITDYYRTPASAKAAVQRYVGRAEAVAKTPLLTIYNIPDRDCGGYSAQQVAVGAKYYRAWVKQVAAGIRGSKPIVVLEPDALPYYGNPACTAGPGRIRLMRFATQKLAAAGAWVYIDAGHSGWQTAAHMAPLLKRAGVQYARGFSTNVANTRSTSDELTFARALVADLSHLGVKGVHYVMDTGRNGGPDSTRPVNGDTCNPVSAHLGAPPRLQFKGAFDGRLWVKNPGESDGPCNGGPPSGDFFATGACRLLGTASSYYDGGTKSCR